MQQGYVIIIVGFGTIFFCVQHSSSHGGKWLWTSKDWFVTVSTFGRCEWSWVILDYLNFVRVWWINIQPLLLSEDMVILKGPMFNYFYFGRMWWSWKDWFLTIFTFGQLCLYNQDVSSSLSVLASLSFVYSTHHHMVETSDFICFIYIGKVPHWCTLNNLGMWHICSIRMAYLLLVHIWQ